MKFRNSVLLLAITLLSIMIGYNGAVYSGMPADIGPWDNWSGGIVSVSSDENKIHDGKHFFFQESLNLDADATQTYLITTPNTDELVFMTFAMDGNAVTEFELFEATDYIGSDTATAYNNNRNSSILPAVVIHDTTTASGSTGLLLKVYKGGAATGMSSRAASVNRGDDQIVLKKNTKYLLRIISRTASNSINVKLMWYEHQPLRL